MIGGKLHDTLEAPWAGFADFYGIAGDVAGASAIRPVALLATAQGLQFMDELRRVFRIGDVATHFFFAGLRALRRVLMSEREIFIAPAESTCVNSARMARCFMLSLPRATWLTLT
jgi:hypothetical protein